MIARSLAVALLVLALRAVAAAQGTPAAPGPPAAPGTSDVQEDGRDRAFVEMLRREDPAEAERFVALRDARLQAIGELQRARSQYQAAGPELRAAFLARLRQADRRYAETSLALLDFLDARDRRALARYREEIARITGFLEERQRTRAELERLRGPE